MISPANLGGTPKRSLIHSGHRSLSPPATTVRLSTEHLIKTLETRLDEVAPIAVHLEQETGCPAQLVIAHWAIESKWGEKPVGHANYFGVKRRPPHEGVHSHHA